MSARYGLRFGPVSVSVDGPPPHPLLGRWVTDLANAARRVVVSMVPALPDDALGATAEVGFALTTHADHDHLALVDDPSRHIPWLAAMCEVVARDAPLRGCLLIHAGAVTVGGGVALLVAPPGVGKTTAVRAAGGRAFASNAVLVEVCDAPSAPIVWAMPFAGEPAPELDSLHPLPLVGVAFVSRQSQASVEWMPASLATMRLMPHVSRPRGADPHARLRTTLALELGGRTRALMLGLPLGPGYLEPLDAALHPTVTR